MRKIVLLLLASASCLTLFSACDTGKPQPKGDTYLETAAKNSAQAKDAEQKINDAAAKATANVDAAMKQAQE